MTGSLCFGEIHTFSFFKKIGVANFAHIQLCNPRSSHHFCPLDNVGWELLYRYSDWYTHAAVDFCGMLWIYNVVNGLK